MAELARYAPSPGKMSRGNALTLLRDGRQAYPAMLAAIAEARASVHLETYILASDRTGLRFSAALIEAARRGVKVRVMFDSLGSLGLDGGYVAALREAGVSVLEYHPISLGALVWDFNRRDHRKILVVDGRVGFTGGLNISDDYASVEDGGSGWRDNHVRVEGPAAGDLDAEFLRVWNAETREWARAVPAVWGREGAAVRVVANRNLILRHLIRHAYIRALRGAERTIDIANSYFIPDRGIRRALRLACARGVKVRLLVPSRSDVGFALEASRHLYAGLLESGARIFEYQGVILHSKTIGVDQCWSAIGSYNMDHRSLLHNLEINLHIFDEAFGRTVREQFELDLQNSTELRAADWRLRPQWTRIKQRLWYSLRYWL